MYLIFRIRDCNNPALYGVLGIAIRRMTMPHRSLEEPAAPCHICFADCAPHSGICMSRNIHSNVGLFPSTLGQAKCLRGVAAITPVSYSNMTQELNSLGYLEMPVRFWPRAIQVNSRAGTEYSRRSFFCLPQTILPYSSSSVEVVSYLPDICHL